jgi:dihydrofolate reductase
LAKKTKEQVNKKNSVFIATSSDGYIADKNGGLDWLNTVPNPENNDMGYEEFNRGIDALIMGRKTFETVMELDIPWPYDKPVFIN